MNFICNGEQGEQGFNSLEDINIEPPGPNCPEGGIRFDSGLDLNDNGVLDPNEITETSFVCNGADGSDNGCSVAAPDTGSSSLLGLMIFALIPAAVMLRRRYRMN